MPFALGIALSIVSSLLPLLLIGGVIYAVVVVARRGGAASEHVEPGIGTLRRLFIYGLALVGLAIGAQGLAMLIGGALDALAGDTVIAESDTEFALGLAFTFVGTPAWVIFWLAAERSLRRHPVEQRSLARRSYSALVRAVALLFVVFNAVQIGEWLLRIEAFEGGPWGFALVWGGVWAFHSRAAALEPAPTTATRLLDHLYVYFAALVGLAMLGPGAARMLQEALQATYDALFLSPVLGAGARRWSEAGRTALAIVAVGGAVWWWHWLRAALRDQPSTLWRLYVFLFGVFGGLAVAVAASAVLLHGVLQWLFGVPDEPVAAAHFDFLPAAVAALVVGAGSWGYHRATLRERLTAAAAERTESERVYRYLVAAAGLATLAAGLVTLFAVTIDAAAAEVAGTLRSAGWWRNPLVLGVTLLAAGTPLWARYWFDAQRHVTAGAAGDRSALSRRTFIFGVFGIAVLAALVNLTIVLFRLFEAALEDGVSAQTVQDVRWSVALLLTAGAISVYYWLVLREDQRALAAEEPQPAAVAPPPKEVVLLVAGSGEALARELQRRLGARVRIWRRLDGPEPAAALSDAQIEGLERRIAAAEGNRAAVIVGVAGDVEVVPYELPPHALEPSEP